MTSTLATTDNAAILAEFTGGSDTDVAMMIGIGLVKDSDAVFFRYLGDEQPAQALSYPSGKPVTRMANVRLSGIEVVDGIGEFASTKLNLFLESSAGTTVMLTSGLQTIWSQCVVTGLMGLVGNGNLDSAISLDTWKGTSKMRPCFAAIRCGDNKMTDQLTYDTLADARSDRNREKTVELMRDYVGMIKGALTGGPVEEAVVAEVDPAAAELF
jgi:hypothetical protein